jgi:hypothetical protein
MALLGYWLPNGSFSVVVKAVQGKGKQTYKKANVVRTASSVTHRSVQLNVQILCNSLEAFDVVW